MVSLPGGDVALGRSKSFRFDPWSKESGILAQRDSDKRFKRWIIHDITVATTVFQMVIQHCYLAWTCQMYWNWAPDDLVKIQHSLAWYVNGVFWSRRVD